MCSLCLTVATMHIRCIFWKNVSYNIFQCWQYVFCYGRRFRFQIQSSLYFIFDGELIHWVTTNLFQHCTRKLVRVWSLSGRLVCLWLFGFVNSVFLISYLTIFFLQNPLKLTATFKGILNLLHWAVQCVTQISSIKNPRPLPWNG